jgi:MFS family permease
MRIGFRPTALIGLAIAAVGALSLWISSSTPNVWSTAGSCLVVGLGLGLVATPTLIAAQASVPWNERAVVTGTNMFMRSVGSAVGVAIFGAIANAVIAGRGGDASRAAVQAGSTAVFLAVLVAAAVSVAAGLLMPHTRAEDVAHGGTGENTPEDAELDLAEPSTGSRTA